MGYVVLVGVPGAIAQGLAARSIESRTTESLPGPEDVQAAGEIKDAAIIVLGERFWRDWIDQTTVVVGEGRAPQGARNWPGSVVVVEGLLDPRRVEAFMLQGATGCVPAARPDWAVESVVAAIKRAAVAREDSAFRVGELTQADASTHCLVAWSSGPWADAFDAIRSAEQALRPLWTDKAARPMPHPFEGTNSAHAVRWLEAYAFEKFGAVFEDRDVGKRAVARLAADTGISPGGLVKRFEDIFMSDSVTRAPTVLLLGETGTGKTLVAKRLHRALVKATAVESLPFHHVNCSTLGDMADVELFGALRGAYTSLDMTNPGAVFASFGGTVFLDEFGTLDKRAQAKLLLFLDDCSVRPMAWTGKPMRVPVLVVAATNEYLEDQVSSGQFRADLFYRFRDGQIRLPPLRETKDRDLPFLVDYFLQVDQPERRVTEVGRGALEALMAHDYPGNVRGLQAALARAVYRATQRRSNQLAQADIDFEKSTLSRQDAVAAIIARDGSRGIEVLLRWNPYWRNWFLSGGRVEAETYEACLERELREKLGLSLMGDAGSYRASPLPNFPEISFIQYSSRDRKLKQYYFHPYLVRLTGEPGFSGHETREGLRWQPVSDLLLAPSATSDLSPTLAKLVPIWRHLNAAVDLATAIEQIPSIQAQTYRT